MDTYGDGSGIQIDLSTSCMDRYQMPPVMWPVGGAPSDWPGEDLTFTLAPDSFSNDGFDVEASLTGYESAATGSGSFDGTTYSGTVQSPYFVGQNFRCASISLINTATNTDPGNAGPEYASDNGWQWLDGYAPPPPPPPPPSSCKTTERDILRWAPNEVTGWHNMTCPVLKRLLRRSRIVANGNLRVPGFKCRLQRRYHEGDTTLAWTPTLGSGVNTTRVW